VDNNGTIVARYVYSRRINEPLGQIRSDVTSYYETDGMGSVSSLSNSSGANAQSYTYDSFGNLTDSTGSVITPFRYTGRKFDSETSLYFYRARYFDPQIGRLISEDSLGFGAGDVNFYNYVGGDPTNYRDPSGQTSIPVIVWGWLCGPNWTGGRFEEYNPAHAALYKEPIDAADAVCKEHVICYYRARDHTTREAPECIASDSRSGASCGSQAAIGDRRAATRMPALGTARYNSEENWVTTLPVSNPRETT
jgi:RHS repeat-associated protein